MSYTFMQNGYEITCDSIAELMDATSEEPRRSFRFMMLGHEVRCDTVEDMQRALEATVAVGIVSSVQAHGTAAPTIPMRPTKKNDSKSQGTGPTRAWELARKYAKKHGISPNEARSILAREKKDKEAEARLKQRSKRG